MNLKTLEDTPPWEWPQEAHQILLRYLNDQQAGEKDRCLAAALAGDYVVINDPLASKLLAIAHDSTESESMRGNAAISLGTALEHADTMGFDDADDILISEELYQRIQATLQSIFQDDKVPAAVRRRILEGSVRAPQKWHAEAIRQAWAEENLNWKITASFCMRFVHGFDEQILAGLQSPEAEVRFQALCAAGNWEVDGAWPFIADLVTSKDTEKEMLLAAIEAAAQIRPQEAVVLLDDFLDDDDEEISEAAFEALTLAGMIDTLDNDEDGEDEDRSLD